MSKSTGIEWTDSTVNPTTGCGGCELWNSKTGVKLCYAGGMTARFGLSNPGLADDFDIVATAPGRMAEAAKWPDMRGAKRPNKPWLDGLPRLIFVSDMADALSRGISYTYLRDEIITAVSSDAGRHHQWQWLTKRPKRMAAFSKWLGGKGINWPSNLWAGTSVTEQKYASRVKDLLDVGDSNTIRFVSVEPQWEPIDLTEFLPELDWVIQGGLSGRHDYPFDVEWAYDLQRQCSDHGVPYFLKQLGSAVREEGEKVKYGTGKQGAWQKWPKRLRVRQMPISKRKLQKQR